MFHDDKINEGIRDFQQISSEHNNLENVLCEMRSRGYSFFETVIALAENAGIDRDEADKMVLESQAWNDLKEKTLKVRNEAMQIMTEGDDVFEDEQGNIAAKTDLTKYRKNAEDEVLIMNRRISLFKSLFAVVVILCISVWLLQVFMGDPYGKELQWTKVSLIILRENIAKFRQIEGRFPESLAELQTRIVQDQTNQYTNRENKEHISTKEGRSDEHESLDGKGGWFYDNKTGEVRVNLSEPLKKYFQHYYVIGRRNQVPAEW